MRAAMPAQDGEAGAPPWFTSAVNTLPEHRSLVVDGSTIAYRVWGDVDRPGLVLIHGGAAHAGWWDHIAPQLKSHRVVALDLSGHGDSDRRPAYDVDEWAGEVIAVVAAESLIKPVVVGHSMGGWVAISVGSIFADQVSAIAVLDSPLNDQPPEEQALRLRMRPTRVYESAAEALSRFATLPPQDLVLPYVQDHIAAQSIRKVEGGWTWKFDPFFFGRRVLLRHSLPRLGCPVAFFRSEHGLVTTEMAAEMATLVTQEFAVVDIPAAGHHPMLDQPLALITGLRTLLALWPTARSQS